MATKADYDYLTAQALLAESLLSRSDAIVQRVLDNYGVTARDQQLVIVAIESRSEAAALLGQIDREIDRLGVVALVSAMIDGEY